MIKSKPGVLLVNKPVGKTSFSLVSRLRKLTNIQKIGHAGTLDPFASGLMILLIGKEFTKEQDRFLHLGKEYQARLHLGKTTTTYDPEGEITSTSDHIPTLPQIESALLNFQGTLLQTPPMFSAKKVHGTPLYKLARQGKEIERLPVPITLKTTLIAYNYPYLDLHVACSKGTYIRSIGHDLGQALTCGAYLETLTRTRIGTFDLSCSLDGALLFTEPNLDYTPHLL